MRILIADDHDLVRDTVKAFMESEGMEVSAVPNLELALKAVDDERLFDVILLDYAMPGMNGLEGLRRMLAKSHGRPVAIISGAATKAVADEALLMGAKGFIPKTLSAESMIRAVRFIALGETYIPASFYQSNNTPPREGDIHLTEREKQVLAGIVEGKSNKEIAIEHDIQEVTVKLHVKTLSRKLGAKNRTQAAMTARNLQLL